MQRPRHSGLKRSETACDQGDDIVEITIVVKARNPRLIWRACMSGWRKGQDGGNETEAHKSVPDDCVSRFCHCHPRRRKNRDGTVALVPPGLVSVNWTCPARLPSGTGDYFGAWTIESPDGLGIVK